MRRSAGLLCLATRSSTIFPTVGKAKARPTLLADPKINDDVESFIQAREDDRLAAVRLANAAIPDAVAPEELTPTFQRVKRTDRLIYLDAATSADGLPRHTILEHTVATAPMTKHPFLERTLYGSHLVHGDGQLGVVGTGRVDFGPETHQNPPPSTWRGFLPTSILGRVLPPTHGKVTPSAEVRLSPMLTGRGLFATEDIEEGTIIMAVGALAQKLGLDDQMSRVGSMVSEILLAALEGGEGSPERELLYQWTLCLQPSALLDVWPEAATDRVVASIGGREALDTLQLHREHIPRLAAIVDMNEFVVESYFDDRRGSAMFAEAAVLNHSCDPNAKYDIIPEHAFRESEYFTPTNDETTERGDDPKNCGTEASSHENEWSQSTDSVAAVPKSKMSTGECDITPAHNDDSRVETICVNAPLPVPRHIFCCRAMRRIAKGEEILISYVPTSWPESARQEVLLDRYRFRCRCPKCSPAVDRWQSFSARTAVATVVVFLVLQFSTFDVAEYSASEATEATQQSMGLMHHGGGACEYAKDPYHRPPL